MLNNKKILAIIPARGGSKGIAYKNIKLLGDKPLLQWTYDAAKNSKYIDKIILSSEDDLIIKVAKDLGIEVPFKRPLELASDFSSTKDVLLHALRFFKEQGVVFDYLVLLQPTSPFRNINHINDCIELIDKVQSDMVVSVQNSASNPYYNLFEDNEMGYLEKSKEGNYTRRQDCPNVYEYNGSIYVININSLQKAKDLNFGKITKYVMEESYLSVDIDQPIDWLFAEFIINQQILNQT